jgi:uncharacterized repeat protein (TIGR01451 family)
MSLNDLNKQIYNIKPNNPGSEHIPNNDPFASSANQPSPFQNEEKWQGANKGMSKKQKIVVWSLVSFFLLIVFSIGGFAFYQNYKKNAFHADRVEISINGPKEADSTQVQQYTLSFKNANKVTLKDAEIFLDYSENFQPTDNLNLKFLSATSSKFWIGDVKPNQSGSVDFKGIFYAPKDFPVYLHATIKYVPSNGTEQQQATNQLAVNITTSPVLLDLTAPEQVVDGDAVEYIIDYKNLDVRPLKDVQIRADFPEGFQFNKAEPVASEQDRIWYLGTLEANQGGKIKISGKISGEKEQGKPIKISLGHMGSENQFAVYNSRDKVSRVVSPVLSIKQALSGSTDNVVKAGDVLNYVITFENTGEIALRDAIVTAQIESNILDFSKLNVDKGSYDGNAGLITWKASEVPKLANIEPKGTGEVRFTVPVKNIIPVENEKDKNFVISSIAKIDSPDIPTPVGSNKIIGSNRLDLKVASKVLFDNAGFYNDSIIKNSGPIPMQVGKSTTFTLHWAIVNVSNDLGEVKVKSSLPSGIKWTGKVFPLSEKISYSERTNELIWEPGVIAAGSGIKNPRKEVAFQVEVIPQVNQVGKTPILLNKSVLSAKDTFTGQDVTMELQPKDSNLTEDKTLNYSSYQVSN